VFHHLTLCSDTTAAVLTCLFYRLALNPQCLKSLQSEVDKLFERQAEVDAAALAKLPYLESVINETLRLHPPVPSGVQRMTPPEGLQIGDTLIPGNTIVQIPSYTMFRGMY
jgi:cytochrome P450